MKPGGLFPWGDWCGTLALTTEQEWYSGHGSPPWPLYHIDNAPLAPRMDMYGGPIHPHGSRNDQIYPHGSRNDQIYPPGTVNLDILPSGDCKSGHFTLRGPENGEFTLRGPENGEFTLRGLENGEFTLRGLENGLFYPPWTGKWAILPSRMAEMTRIYPPEWPK